MINFLMFVAALSLLFIFGRIVFRAAKLAVYVFTFIAILSFLFHAFGHYLK